ncbi:MAG: hypothetical protein PW734_07560 [Verrucomicrobium sp.]|nr:hypothetical protein [Verrucomicrobium sp.]
MKFQASYALRFAEPHEANRLRNQPRELADALAEVSIGAAQESIQTGGHYPDGLDTAAHNLLKAVYDSRGDFPDWTVVDAHQLLAKKAEEIVGKETMRAHAKEPWHPHGSKAYLQYPTLPLWDQAALFLHLRHDAYRAFRETEKGKELAAAMNGQARRAEAVSVEPEKKPSFLDRLLHRS